MDLKSLTYIVAIAEEQNLSKAAERLFVSQSTLSLFLHKLEEELGVLLFNRVKNRLIITPAGKLYVETAEQILDMKKELYTTLLSPRREQTLNIGIASQMVLKIFARVFADFNVLMPNFHVNITEGRTVALLKKFYDKELDIAIVGRSESIQDDNYKIDLLKKEEMWLMIPPGHPHAHAASRDYNNPPVADMGLFSGEDFALSPRDTCDYQLAQAIFRDYHMNARVICELNSTHAICQMVLEGVCLSISPAYCVPRDIGILVCRPARPYYRYLLCFQHKKRHPSAEETTLMNMLCDAYSHYYDK